MRVISRGIWKVLIENTRNRRWHWDARPEGRSYGDVMTKFSRLDGLPIFLTNVASRAEAPLWLPTQTDFALQIESVLWLAQPSSPCFSYFNFYGITKFEIWERNKKRRAISGGCRPMSQSWKFLTREAKSNVDFWVWGVGGKQEYPRKNISEQNREQTKSMAPSPTWNPGYIDGGQIL